jgi:hypothetical protein
MLAVALAAGCGSSDLKVSGAPPSSTYVETFAGESSDAELGRVRFRPEVCRGIDTRPAGRVLEADDLVTFLRRQGVETRLVRVRSDLVFVDALNAGTPAPIRFRVAVLDAPGAAGHELHTALLQHGSGAWGVQRSNLAVLAPGGSADDVVAFAGKLKLPCWGVFMMAGHDDTFVVPGGYTEL